MSGFFSTAELTVWPQITLVVFLVFFIGITLWVFRPSGSQSYRDASRLPLDDSDNLKDK